ncbi:MAG: DUF2088 domain-containing protein [Rhodospirillaceae bacterium]|nr:DUF2088 domain-containing protein [Rhodospirillaceae bacterium]|tara:strand:+ start:14404 stop:15711 length:1308 start_codon:yes stop_codon:yes gene_type:complete
MDDRKSPIFPEIRLPMAEKEPLPGVLRVRLKHPDAPAIREIRTAVRNLLNRSKRFSDLDPGSRIAITCGSRGIKAKPEVVRTSVEWMHERGFKPFIVPAMGSHGGGSAEAQTTLLKELGYTEETMGCPIKATMEVVQKGVTSQGVPVYFDRFAADADAVLVVNRVKQHTSFPRDIESGIVKMVSIGLGKAEGARLVHRLGPKGYAEVLPEWARIAIDNSPIAYGIGIVENSRHDAVIIEGAEPEDFHDVDSRLLINAKELLPKLPFSQIDVLVVETLGKNISGSGMDPAVSGRAEIRGQDNPKKPFVHKLVILGVTPESHGNGLGVGAADFTTKAVVDGLDLYAMYLNATTATSVEKVRLPPALADESQAIRAAVASSWRLDGENARLCIIRSTLYLDEILISPSLAAELGTNDELISDIMEIEFDSSGKLLTRV